MPLTMLAASTEYVTSTITADHDITNDAIQVSLPLTGAQPSNWISATVLGVVPGSGKWTATYRLLVGPQAGDVSLEAGSSYDWYVKVTDSPEVPVRKVDTIKAV